MKILVTGATGNVGREILNLAFQNPGDHEWIPGLRDPRSAGKAFPGIPGLQARAFDFEDPSTFPGAFSGIERVFLLRPPHISRVQEVFAPLVTAMQAQGVKSVVFLSVQGAEKSSWVPHHKIEKLLEASGMDWVFLRPSYFMQNLTTTLWSELQTQRRITLPAARGRFNWLDVRDLAEVSVEVLIHLETYKGRGLTVSGAENLDFFQVVQRIGAWMPGPWEYRPVGLWKFYRLKRREGLPRAQVLVMTLLHFLPRVQGAPEIVPTIKDLLHREPRSLEDFLESRREDFQAALKSD